MSGMCNRASIEPHMRATRPVGRPGETELRAAPCWTRSLFIARTGTSAADSAEELCSVRDFALFQLQPRRWVVERTLTLAQSKPQPG